MLYKGYKIIGVREAAARTHNHWGNSWHYQVFYDTESGEVWTSEIYGLNNWLKPHSESVYSVLDTQRHVTMNEIKEAVIDCMYWLGKFRGGEN